MIYLAKILFQFRVANHQSIPHSEIYYTLEIENALAELMPKLTVMAKNYPCDCRWLAVRLLENDTLAQSIAGADLLTFAAQLQQQIEAKTGDEIDILAADARYEFVNQLTKKAVCKLSEVSRHTSEKIDRIVLNRFLGIPIFLLVMYTMFLFTINIGSAFGMEPMELFSLSIPMSRW